MPSNNRKSTGAKNLVQRSKENERLNFNENDRSQLNEIYDTVKLLKDEIHCFKEELEASNSNLAVVKAENERLKQALTLTNFKVDSLEQYGRRENLRLHNIPETGANRDDGENEILKVANALNIELTNFDIQRAHRLGRKRINASPDKPRPIIVRFQSYKKRNQFLQAKGNLKKTEQYKNVFISEDLTPLRAKLLHFIKHECEDKFVQCHTIKGKIRFKKSAMKEGLPPDENGRDPGVGNWIMVTSPDDFFRAGVKVDFTKINFEPLRYLVDPDCSQGQSKNLIKPM